MVRCINKLLIMAVLWGMGALAAQACMTLEALPLIIREATLYSDVAAVMEDPPIVEAKIANALVLTLPKTKADDVWKIQNLAQIERSFNLRIEDTPTQTTFTLKYLRKEGLSEQKDDEEFMRTVVLQRPLELVYRHAGQDSPAIAGQLLVLTNLQKVVYPEISAALIEVNTPLAEGSVNSHRPFQIHFGKAYAGGFTWRVKSAVAEAYDREKQRTISTPLELNSSIDQDGKQIFEGEGAGERMLIELQAEIEEEAGSVPKPVKIIIHTQPTPVC